MYAKVGISALLFFSCVVIIYVNRNRDPPGHLQPFGSHFPPLNVDTVTEAPNPVEFFENYVKPGIPLMIKGVAKKFTNFEMWKNDEYLREKYGKWLINVEVGKYEGYVYGHGVLISLSEFIDVYKSKDYYLIGSILPDNPMTEEVLLLKSMACGGFAEHVDTVYLFFSSGATKSALHWDDVENFHCVLDGTKEWMMYDKKYRPLLPIMKDFPAYVDVDCRSVDMYKYPIFQELPWHRAFLTPGDCIYMPNGWAHHVKSEGNQRNMGLALWLGRMHHVNTTDCPANLNDIPEATPLGSTRITLLQKAKLDIYALFDDKVLPTPKLLDELDKLDLNEKEKVDFANKLDSDNDGVVTIEEIEGLTFKDVSHVKELVHEERERHVETEEELASNKKLRSDL